MRVYSCEFCTGIANLHLQAQWMCKECYIDRLGPI